MSCACLLFASVLLTLTLAADAAALSTVLQESTRPPSRWLAVRGGVGALVDDILVIFLCRICITTPCTPKNI